MEKKYCHCKDTLVPKFKRRKKEYYGEQINISKRS